MDGIFSLATEILQSSRHGLTLPQLSQPCQPTKPNNLVTSLLVPLFRENNPWIGGAGRLTSSGASS